MRTMPALATGLLLIAACGSENALETPTDTTVTGPPTTTEPDEPDSTSTSPDAAPTTDPVEPTTTAAGEPDESTTSTTAPSGDTTADQLAAVAIDDLMTRIGVERSSIDVRSVEEVTWRDGAIGCPDPDFQYPQALVPGIRVILDHDGFAYHYHQGGGRDLFYCPTPEDPIDE